ANAQYVQDALAMLDFFCVQDLFFSTSARFADVVLAACPSLEKEGTFANTERRIQRLYRAMEPLGESRPDWEILTDLAARLGHRWGYTHPSQIMAEAARTTPLFAGVSYERLEGYGSLCWPVAPDGTDTPLLYTEHFHFPDGKARLYPLTLRTPTDQPDAEYDLHLNNGRVLEHFHEGNMTLRSKGLTRLVPGAYVEVSPALAEARTIETGDWVRLVSRRGAVKVQALVSEVVSGHELYMPMTSPDAENAVNVLTSNEVDSATHTPAYKEVAVRMEKLGQKGKRPLPATHHRYGTPTPQRGVEVERKWDRPDYALPVLPHPPVGYPAA
ncbi:MAG TPA: molybdopterin dinucleotide binding domain-containing protein, partial [Rhodothermales bacterium]|nr:molybdopterin dinucleotide binding domain-containing protein [Rhodothermales bacterium]